MSKRCLFTVFSIISFFMFFSFVKVEAATDTYGNGEYAITEYKVDIVVNEDNVYRITESIKVHFSEPQHGITRKIPIKNKITRLDGSKSKNRAKISNIDVNTKFKKSIDSDYLEIKIGDAKKTVEGYVDYKISYTYDIGNDKVEGFDELYFNIIGDEWDTTISNIEFTITMPKEFDATKLGFSSGRRGYTNSSSIIYKVEDKIKINGEYQGVLKAREGITVRLELPEGYFNTRSPLDFKTKVMIIIPVIMLVISFMLWNRYGKDDKVVETVEFYPPSGFNSAEVGLLYKGESSDKDVISLLIYLANEGYLRIEESENETQKSKNNSFKIIKVKDYDGNNFLEKRFMDGLFRRNKKRLTKDDFKYKLYEAAGGEIEGDFEDIFKELVFAVIDEEIDEDTGEVLYEISGGVIEEDLDELLSEILDEVSVAAFDNMFYESADEITSENLKYKFHKTIEGIKNKLNGQEKRKKLFDEMSLEINALLILFIGFTFFLITSIPMISGGQNILMLILQTIFPGIGFAIIISALFSKDDISIRASLIFIGTCMGVYPWYKTMLPILKDEPTLMIAYIIGFTCVFLIYLIKRKILKRTPFAKEMLGKILGFKRFLEVADKAKLEALVMENPVYFYDILPYTYVLDISDKWIEKFEAINLQSPDWYQSTSISGTAFSIYSFNNSINTTMKTASKAMTSTLSSSSSAGSFSGGSGGGLSGGGSGGGGGSSW